MQELAAESPHIKATYLPSKNEVVTAGLLLIIAQLNNDNINCITLILLEEVTAKLLRFIMYLLFLQITLELNSVTEVTLFSSKEILVTVVV